MQFSTFSDRLTCRLVFYSSCRNRCFLPKVFNLDHSVIFCANDSKVFKRRKSCFRSSNFTLKFTMKFPHKTEIKYVLTRLRDIQESHWYCLYLILSYLKYNTKTIFIKTITYNSHVSSIPRLWVQTFGSDL